ncbi:MAG: response regulator transcription factor [Acidimicrobiales bacterium]
MSETVLVIGARDACALLADALSEDRYAVVTARTRVQGRRLVENEPSAIVLDGAWALDLCRDIRRRRSTPIVVVGDGYEEADVVDLLDAGADDVVVDPERRFEFVARVRAVLRRSAADRSAWASNDQHWGAWSAGGVEIDTIQHLVSVDGEPLELPLKQFALLSLLVRRAGSVVTRREIHREVWGPGISERSKTLDVHIRRLRHAIEADPLHPTRILTARGLGFRFVSLGADRHLETVERQPITVSPEVHRSVDVCLVVDR